MASWKHERRALPVAIPEPTPALRRERATQEADRQARAIRERRGTVRAVLLIGLIVLLASMARAGMARVFPPGWWQW